MTLNLKDPKDLEVFKRFAEQADVVVENFRPDVKAKLGIDYESLRQINPRIVYGSISGFGQNGPYHKRPGFDQIAQSTGGLTSISGAPARARCGSASPSPTPPPGCSRYSNARFPEKACGCRPRCCRPRSSCWISRPRAG